MSDEAKQKAAIVRLKLAAGDLHTGVAMGSRLFDVCAREGLVTPRRFDSYRVGFTTSLLGTPGVPVFVLADVEPFEFKNGMTPDQLTTG